MPQTYYLEFFLHCMKMKEIGPGGGARVSNAPPHPPMITILSSKQILFSIGYFHYCDRNSNFERIANLFLSSDGSIGWLVPNLAKSKNINLDEVVIEISLYLAQKYCDFLFFSVYGLECYACMDQDSNKDKCIKTTKQCDEAWTPA